MWMWYNIFPIVWIFLKCEMCTFLKCEMSTFLTIEYKSPRVNFTHFLEKNAPSHSWVDFHQLELASLHAYKICLKQKFRMVQKSSLFVKWAPQNNLDLLAATL